jgi:hypothetical protein
VLVNPRTWSSELLVLDTARVRDRVEFGGGMLALLLVLKSRALGGS